MKDDGAWVEVEIDLGPPPLRAAAATRLWHALDGCFADERGEHGWPWLVRKSPGVRLRIRVEAIDRVAAVDRMLAELRREGVVADAYRRAYEPESRRFGGERAMSLVHRFFHVDTAAWLACARATRFARRRLSDPAVSLAAISTLFEALFGEATSESWDAWANVAVMHGLPIRDETAVPLPACTCRQLASFADPEEAQVLRAYGQAADQLARGVAALRRDGDFAVGLRAFAADLVLFHWNRHGLAAADRKALITGSLAALDPHRDLHAP